MTSFPSSRKKTKSEIRKQEVITNLSPLTQEDFKKEFIPKEFIENLTESLLIPGAMQGEHLFDPEPFHIAFEHTLKNLQQLREYVDKSISKRAKACQTSERDFKSKLKDLNKSYTDISEAFKALDTRISVISKKAVRIGHSLESVETERANAENAKKLIQHIMNLNSDDESKMQELMKMSASEDPEDAHTIKSLLTIAQELDIDQTEKAKGAIIRLSQDLQENLIKKFVSAAKYEKYPVMRHIAEILFVFNGGDSCIRAYIETLDFLKSDWVSSPPPSPPQEEVENFEPKPDDDSTSDSSDQSDAVVADEEIPEIEELDLAALGLSETNIPSETTPGTVEAEPMPDFTRNKTELDVFFKEMLQHLRHEHEVIHKVFKLPYEVFERLVRKAFSTRITDFVSEMLIDRRDLECYLKTLAHAVRNCENLAKDISDTTFNVHVVIAEVVMKALCKDYIAIEEKSMKQFLKVLLDDYLEEKKKQYERRKNREELERTKLSALVEGILGQEEMQPELDLNPEISFQFIARVQEAVKRCILLSPDILIAENMTIVFKTLIIEFGNNYMCTCLKTAIDRIPEDPRDPPNTTTFFDCVAMTNSNVISIQRLFFADVRPYIEGATNEHTICSGKRTDLLHTLELLIVQGLTKCLQSLLLWVKKLLSRDQGRNDFRPSAEDELNIGEITKACHSVCIFIEQQLQIVDTNLDGKNRDAFLTEFGKKILEIILVHIRKFTISYGTGGLALMADLRRYREIIKKFKVPSLNEEFQFLEHIEKIFMVKAEQLKEYIENTPLKLLKQEELESYLTKRTDYNRSWLGKYF